jgi:hypothetical protein
VKLVRAKLDRFMKGDWLKFFAEKPVTAAFLEMYGLAAIGCGLNAVGLIVFVK